MKTNFSTDPTCKPHCTWLTARHPTEDLQVLMTQGMPRITLRPQAFVDTWLRAQIPETNRALGIYRRVLRQMTMAGHSADFAAFIAVDFALKASGIVLDTLS